MADIFISHSGKDSEAAAALGERIRRDRPTWSLFYDKDNIRAGQYWQERLREELISCRVVLARLAMVLYRGGDRDLPRQGRGRHRDRGPDRRRSGGRATHPARTPAGSPAGRRQPGLAKGL